jgi:hypothetical protein
VACGKPLPHGKKLQPIHTSQPMDRHEFGQLECQILTESVGMKRA